MKLAFIGCGYVGLVSGACFAALGHEVVCVDNNRGKVLGLQAARIPIHEAGLEEMVAANIAAGRLTFTDDIGSAVAAADAVFLAVGTPSRLEDGEADLSYVFAAVDTLAAALPDGAILVSKSTVPVGTGDRIAARLAQLRDDIDVDIVSCPEFLREGTAIEDFMHPHRIVIGTNSPRAEAAMRRAYGPLIAAGAPFLVMDRRSSELTKYAANAFLATKLAFINEMADFAESVSADIEAVAQAIGLDPRIGASYLRAGPGFGGSCFPKDAMALHRTGEEVQAAMRIVETVIAVNDQRKRGMANRIIDACGGEVEGKTIALLGVTFKAGTDDLRDSPAIPIVRRLIARGARINAYDPGVSEDAYTHPSFEGVNWADSVLDAADGASATVITTDWEAFANLDLAALALRMESPRIVDLRNLYDPAKVAAAGMDYISIGRAPEFAKSASPAVAPEGGTARFAQSG